MKKVFTFNVILYYYNLDHKIMIEINTLNYMFKDILSQYDENNVLYSVAYFLKKHNSAKCNYKIYNKEFIIIIYAFKE